MSTSFFLLFDAVFEPFAFSDFHKSDVKIKNYQLIITVFFFVSYFFLTFAAPL